MENGRRKITSHLFSNCLYSRNKKCWTIHRIRLWQTWGLIMQWASTAPTRWRTRRPRQRSSRLREISLALEWKKRLRRKIIWQDNKLAVVYRKPFHKYCWIQYILHYSTAKKWFETQNVWTQNTCAVLMAEARQRTVHRLWFSFQRVTRNNNDDWFQVDYSPLYSVLYDWIR